MARRAQITEDDLWAAVVAARSGYIPAAGDFRVQDFAAKTGVSDKAAKSNIRRMIERGEVERVHTGNGGASWYRFTPQFIRQAGKLKSRR